MRILYVEDNSNDIDLLDKELKRTFSEISMDVATTIASAKSKSMVYIATNWF